MTGRVAKAWFRFDMAVMVGGTALLALWLAVAPARAQSAADLMDRIQRLEAQVRSLNGQLEQSQFRVRQMEDQQRRMQADIEFRLNELENARGGARRPQQPPAGQPPQQPQQQGQPPQRRSDAFDPSEQQAAPGAPRDLGTLPPGSNAAPPRTAAAGGAGGAQPLDLGQLAGRAAADPSLDPAEPRSAIPGAVASTGSTGTQPIIASSPRDEYNAAVAFISRRDYEQAEIALRAFLQNHPRDRLVGDATHQLGETMYQRRQYREAAEQFLKVSTDFPRASRAPSSLLRLGQSLNALGEREAACAAYAEFNRKFPNAAPATKTAVVSEQRRASC
ncbi:tol-pal system protein YbgF [Phreatobacter oligotrophus]|uniref:tol-pal system protein YbgF n=1 Tax=Phreatobacter oligotrophus TaxID=1122261 RepID=UPI0023529C40|nr:tol-pal system protein YbgF [Phreatobacter oligotrophus]MBX9992106.1 tol-pal system protein YbgF [Phreatobacter oligotrophus]